MKIGNNLNYGELLITVLLLIFSIFVFYQAYLISGFSSIRSAGAFPIAASITMTVSMMYVVIGNLKGKERNRQAWKKCFLAISELIPMKVFIFILLIAVYMISLNFIGFIVSTFLFLVIGVFGLKGASLRNSFLISILSVISIYLIFNFLFQVELP